jgi:hypothetical protein
MARVGLSYGELNFRGGLRVQLRELIADLEHLDEELFICARRPWAPDAEAQLTQPDERLAVPEDVKKAGFVYFLDVPIAREVIGVFGQKTPSLDEKVRLLLHYAEHDAYPDWVYHR